MTYNSSLATADIKVGECTIRKKLHKLDLTGELRQEETFAVQKEHQNKTNVYS